MVKVNLGLWQPSFLQLEVLDDFNGIYVAQLQHLSQGFLPYRDFAYSYPPLFLYALYPFYVLGGYSLAGLPVVVSDAATALLVYLILARYADGKIAFAAGLVCALSPFMLLYEGYLWLSGEPMVFLVLLSFYLLQKGKPKSSAICLGIAVLSNQDAFFVFPAYFAALWSNHSEHLAKGFAITLSTVFLGCAEFLVLAPAQFLSYVSFSTLAAWVPPLVFHVSNGLISEVSIPPGTCLTMGTSALSSICATASPQSPLASPLGESYAILTSISALVLLPLAVLTGPALFAVRRRQGFVFLMGAYSSTVLFALFTIAVHPDFYRYYFLIVYSMLLAASWNRALLSVAAAVEIISLVTPSGVFQEILPLGALLAMALILDLDGRSQGAETRNGMDFSLSGGGELGRARVSSTESLSLGSCRCSTSQESQTYRSFAQSEPLVDSKCISYLLQRMTKKVMARGNWADFFQARDHWYG